MAALNKAAWIAAASAETHGFPSISPAPSPRNAIVATTAVACAAASVAINPVPQSPRSPLLSQASDGDLESMSELLVNDSDTRTTNVCPPVVPVSVSVIHSDCVIRTYGEN